jgi:quercetin dioxygenase-like cupin family protein
VAERPSEGPVIHDRLLSLGTEERQLVVYDAPIGLRLLYQDPLTGEEHYLVRYPAALKAQWHRHTAAHTLVVLEGRLEVNGVTIGPGAYCHYAAGVPMHHAPAGDEACVFLNLFHGPFDVEPLGDQFSS